jgi:1-aminocyclopropane-1-carboxylate deaminase
MERQLLPHTRIHPFPLVQRPGLHVYLKRDDDAGGLIAAGKLRKYASLLPALEGRGVRTAALIGSANSNNLPGLAQLLIERGIRPVPFVLEGHHSGSNAFYLRLLVPESDWVKVARDAWPQVEALAQVWQQAREAEGEEAVVIPEGCWMQEALYGAMALTEEIAAQERELGLRFEHIFMDAGTGLSAMGLHLGWPVGDPRPKLHVVSMADEAEVFAMRWEEASRWLGRDPEGVIGSSLLFYRPRGGRSFGSIQGGLLKDVVRFAREYGVFCDPIYNAKLFAEAEAILQEDLTISGNVLLIHSGGAHVLGGFSEKLEPLL